MKKCPNCGALNNSNATFCVHCGQDLSQVASQPQHEENNQSREQYNNQKNQPSQISNPSKDVSDLLSDIKSRLGTSNGKRPWFKSLDGALAAIVVLLIIIVIELGIAISNLSDIDNTVGASHNQDDNQSYVIQHHHQHKLPKLQMTHHKAHI